MCMYFSRLLLVATCGFSLISTATAFAVPTPEPMQHPRSIVLDTSVLVDDAFTIQPHETLHIVNNISIEASGPINILGPVVARKGNPTNGGWGASIRIVSPVRIHIEHNISAGGGQDATDSQAHGGSGGTLILAAPRIDFGVQMLNAESGGHGGPNAHGGHDASYHIFADTITYTKGLFLSVKAGNGGRGGNSNTIEPTDPKLKTLHGGNGGNGGDALIKPWVDYIENSAALDSLSLVELSTGLASRPAHNMCPEDEDESPPSPGQSGRSAKPGFLVQAGHGGHGAHGAHGTLSSPSGGSGGDGGRGGMAIAGHGGNGAPGTDFCPPLAKAPGPGGNGGNGGAGGNAIGGDGGSGGHGGHPFDDNSWGGFGGNAGGGGVAAAGNGGSGGSAARGTPPGQPGAGGMGGIAHAGRPGKPGRGGGLPPKRAAGGSPAIDGTARQGNHGKVGDRSSNCP